MNKDIKQYSLSYVLHLMEVYCDLKEGNFRDDYEMDENSALCKGNEYEHQLDNIDKSIVDMVEKDVQDALDDCCTENFQRRELLRKEFYGEMGIEYKTIMDFFPDIRVF